MSVNQNDWVLSYSKGIWRVLREIPQHYEARFSLEEPKELYDGPLYLVKRLVNDKWKRSFEIESAHGAFVRKLSKSDSTKLDAFLSENTDILHEFEEYDRPLLDLLNIGFALKRKTDRFRLKKEVETALGDVSAGVTSDSILRAIGKTSFARLCGEHPQSASLQFVNKNYEIRRRELVYREMKTLDF